MIERANQLKKFILSRPEQNICLFGSAFIICYLQYIFGLPYKPIGYCEVIKFEM